uniref:Putative fun14 domain containing n=1 Tax=Schistosoma mansoni TaxID=6183 RepID=G4VTA1_SCHMA
MTRTEDQSERALTVVKDTLDDIKSRPHRQQVIIGVGSGLLAGYIFAKIGRAAALLLGGSLIALQCAVQQDVIHINWRKVERAGDRIQSNTPVIFEGKIIKTIEENRVFFGSFGGGFLIAISFA